MKTISKIIGVMVILMIITSCKKKEVAPSTSAVSFRVINAFEGTADQDFYLGSTKLNTAPIAYGSNSEQLNTTISNDALTFFFKNSATGTITTDVTGNLEAGLQYTVFLNRKSNGSPEIVFFQEQNQMAVPAGTAMVRFVNLSSNTITIPGIDLTGYINNPPRIVSPYRVVDISKDLTATNGPASVTVKGNEFKSGGIYTVWFDGASATVLKYHVAEQVYKNYKN